MAVSLVSDLALPLGLLGVEWTRPAGFLALLAPLVLLLFLRRPKPPRSEATGTLELWRRLEARELSSAARTRHGMTWRAWLLCAALALAALAIAGPRKERTPRVQRWRVVVDRSPSMYLPLEPDGTEARYDAALAEAQALLAEAGADVEEVRWITPGEAAVSGAAPPSGWARPPEVPRGEPRWERWDAPGTLWVTDRATDPLPTSAGLAASGGAAVPGPVGAAKGRLLVWDGIALVEDGPPPPGRVEVDEALPEELRRLLAIWAEERGLALEGGGGTPRLHSVAISGGDSLEVAAGRGAWRLTGRAAAAGVPAEREGVPLEAWLEAEDGGVVLVAFAPGRLAVALTALDSIDGDPAAFAASWAELFDLASLPPEGTLSLEERSSAGEARRIAPTPAAVVEETSAEEIGLEAWLALLAAILAVVAWSGRAIAGRTAQ